MSHLMGRRPWLLAAGGLLTTGLAQPALVSAQTVPPKPDRIVVHASGGSMNAIFRRSYFAAFERRHGIRVQDT